MRIGSVSKETGVPVSTLKYYLREGLLPRGELTAANQAQYGEAHVERVRLIRALIEVGGLTTSQVKAVLRVVDDRSVSVFDALAVSQDALAQPLPVHPDQDDRLELGRRWVTDFVQRQGFVVRADAPVREELAATLVWMDKFGITELDAPTSEGDAYFDYLAEFARQLAEFDIGFIAGTDRSQVIGDATVGTVLVDQAFAAIRRMANEDTARRHFGEGQNPG